MSYDDSIADAPLLRCTVCGCAYHVQAPRPVPLPFVCLRCVLPQEPLPHDAARILRENLWGLY